jgi:hypothetical protein
MEEKTSSPPDPLPPTPPAECRVGAAPLRRAGPLHCAGRLHLTGPLHRRVWRIGWGQCYRPMLTVSAGDVCAGAIADARARQTAEGLRHIGFRGEMVGPEKNSWLVW